MSQIIHFGSNGSMPLTSLVVDLTTIDNTPTTMYSIGVPDQKMAYMHAVIIGKQDDNLEGTTIIVRTSALNNGIGTDLLLNLIEYSENDDDSDPIATGIVTLDNLILQIIGDPDETYNWRAYIQYAIY